MGVFWFEGRRYLDMFSRAAGVNGDAFTQRRVAATVAAKVPN
jgi:hypothetical protein